MQKTEDKKTEDRRLEDRCCSGAPRNFPEPLPCPFCGGRPRVVSDGSISYVECQNSDCHSNPSVNAGIIPDAIRCWNIRKGGTSA